MFNELANGFVTAAWIISAPFWVLNAALIYIGWVLWQIWRDGR
jgi:hypothetical protein